jgi:YVTN family beta-propeller protein
LPTASILEGEFSLKPPLLGLLVLCSLLWGCQASLSQFWPSLEEVGEVYLYLQPFSQEAQRLSFSIDAISAISSDGKEIPFSVPQRELKGGDIRRQRLLATGFLPPDEYSGFSFRTKSAFLKGEGGESALRVPEVPTKVDFKFSVSRRKGYVLSLALRYAESVEAGFSFTPAFSIYFPDRPAVGLMGFVANSRSNDITVFNKRSLQVFDVIATGRGPSGMALDQRSRRAYVALSGEDSVDVIDIAAGTISDRIRLNPGDEPWELALTPDGRTLLSANRGSNTVSIIDTSSRVELTRIRVGNGPSSIVIEQTGRRAFVVNNLSNTLSVLDIPGGGLITSIATDPGPVRAQFNRRGDKLYVIHELSPYIGVINPTLLVAAGRFPVRSGMVAEKVDTNTDLVYLARKRDFVVGISDPLSFATVGFVNTGASVVQMSIDGDENTLFMVSPDTRRILVSTLIGNRMVGQLDVGEGPYWVALMGER